MNSFKYSMTNIIPIIPVKDTPLASSDKDWVMLNSMLKYARKQPQHNLIPINIDKSIKKTKLALLVLPEWGIYFPPYNLSRLAGVTRNAGYETTIYDINVKAYHSLKSKTNTDFWHPSREWMWNPSWYEQKIRQYVEPVLEEYLEIVAEYNPDVIGFSMYYTNETPTNWMAENIRKLLPNAKIIAGGPQALSMREGSENYYDHIVQGEGEQVLLDLLDAVEQSQPTVNKYLKASQDRLNLDSLPYPDYSYFDLNEYQIPNGISAEISRGCVASCVFCNEVHFWKYRGRQALHILNEIEHQYNKYNIDYVWFIDSLVNGNLNELRAFCVGVVEKGIKIKWQGYARCDGRMDLEYFKDLKNSGCEQLNYGIESGSNQVLQDMKKSITVDVIEQNLKDGSSVGISNATNWIIGFPTEKKQDFSDTLTLVWRTRNYLNYISPGITMMLSPGSSITSMEASFNVSPFDYQGAWASFDLSNTKLHRLIRQKSFLIFLQHLESRQPVAGVDRPGLDRLYSITYNKNNINESIEYDNDFNYNIVKTDNEFANGLINEIWPLFRTFWKSLGAYSINIKYNPNDDLQEFGDRLAGNYTANYDFKIDQHGNWSANFYCKYIQEIEIYDNSPWVEDLSFEISWSDTGYWL